jgi:hypothetical protein
MKPGLMSIAFVLLVILRVWAAEYNSLAIGPSDLDPVQANPTATLEPTTAAEKATAPTHTAASLPTRTEQARGNRPATVSLIALFGAAGVVAVGTIAATVFILRSPARQEQPGENQDEPQEMVPQEVSSQQAIPQPVTLPEQVSAPSPASQGAVDVTPLSPYLECRSSSGTPLRLGFHDRELTLGRALDNDLIIDERFPNYDSVSRYHATIRNEYDHWIIYDEGKTGNPSTNGIYVENRRTKKNVLRTGWLVTIGLVEFVFHEGGNEG